MHGPRLAMEHRRRRTEDLHERAPALINLPITLPTIPIVNSLLGPILTPIIDGAQAPTTSTQQAHTSPATQNQPQPDPTTTAASPPATTAATGSNSNGSTGNNNGSTGNNNGSTDNNNGTGGNNSGDNNSSPSVSVPPSSSNPNGSTSSPTNPPPNDSIPSGSPNSDLSSNPGSPSTTSNGIVINVGGNFVTSGANDERSTATNRPDANGGTSFLPGATINGGSPGSSTSVPGSSPTGNTSGDPHNPVVNATSASGVSAGAIAGIVLGVLALLGLLLVCCLRRRAIAARVSRRKQWARGAAVGNRDYSDKDGHDSPASARSSFATSYDRGFTNSPPLGDPFANAMPPLMSMAGTNSTVAASMGVPAVNLYEPMDQGWTTELQGKPVTFPPASHAVDSFATATTRSGDNDRDSLSSCNSRPSSLGSSEEGQFLTIAQPPSATLAGSPYELPVPSPFSVRPFSPSEKWSFPKPPASQSYPGGLPESENPFADFTDAVSVETHGSGTTAEHFSAVETIQRTFMPSMNDEMGVQIGDHVRIVRRFDDGWAIAENLAKGTQGLIPIDCLRAPEEELPAFLAKKRISSYHASVRGSAISGSAVGAAM